MTSVRKKNRNVITSLTFEDLLRVAEELSEPFVPPPVFYICSTYYRAQPYQHILDKIDKIQKLVEQVGLDCDEDFEDTLDIITDTMNFAERAIRYGVSAGAEVEEEKTEEIAHCGYHYDRIVAPAGPVTKLWLLGQVLDILKNKRDPDYDHDQHDVFNGITLMRDLHKGLPVFNVSQDM